MNSTREEKYFETLQRARSGTTLYSETFSLMALVKQFPFYKMTARFPLIGRGMGGGGTLATASSQSAISPCWITPALLLNIHIEAADGGGEPAGRYIAYRCGGITRGIGIEFNS